MLISLSNQLFLIQYKPYEMKTVTLKLLFFVLIITGLLCCQPPKTVEPISFPSKTFVINSARDTTLFGTQGTRIFIGANTFQFSNGQTVLDSITIELKEFYKKSDIILAELSTKSNGQLLETGGMLHINALANNEALNIRPNKKITVHFPKAPNNYKKMDLFYADANSTDTSVSNWTIDTVDLVKRTLKLASFGWWSPAHDDSTEYRFRPKNFIDTGYYWNPLDFYVKSYTFTEATLREIETIRNVNNYPDFGSWNDYGVECEMFISMTGFITAPKIKTKLSRKAKQEILSFLNSLPQLEAGKNKYGETIVRRGLLFITPDITPLYKSDKAYLQSFDQKYAQFEQEPIQNMDDAEMNYYIFSVGKLGWINCDRFIEFEEKVDLLVDLQEQPQLKLKMVFNTINGVLKPQVKDGKYLFRQVPLGQKATIVGIDNNGSKLLAAIKPITINKEPIKSLNFSTITLAELRTQLETL